MIEAIAYSFHSSRTTLHRNTAVAACGTNPKLRQILHVEIDVARDHQVHKAVAVIVSKSSARAPSRIDQVSLLSYICECAVPVIAIEHESFFASNEDVGPAIVVIVRDSSSHGPARIAQSRVIGDISKCAVVIVVVQSAARFFASQGSFDCRRIREVNVKPAVLVVIEQQDAAAHRFD